MSLFCLLFCLFSRKIYALNLIGTLFDFILLRLGRQMLLGTVKLFLIFSILMNGGLYIFQFVLLCVLIVIRILAELIVDLWLLILALNVSSIFAFRLFLHVNVNVCLLIISLLFDHFDWCSVHFVFIKLLNLLDFALLTKFNFFGLLLDLLIVNHALILTSHLFHVKRSLFRFIFF